MTGFIKKKQKFTNFLKSIKPFFQAFQKEEIATFVYWEHAKNT